MPIVIEDVSQKLPRHPTETPEYRRRSLIKGIAIHHSADWDTPLSWATYHITPASEGGPDWSPNGNPTVCYHAAVMRVDAPGETCVFKLAPDGIAVNGVAGMNESLIHIVMQGNLSESPPTEWQMEALLFAVRKYMNAYAIPVSEVRDHGEWARAVAERTGRDTWLTSCPGLQGFGAIVRGALRFGVTQFAEGGKA